MKSLAAIAIVLGASGGLAEAADAKSARVKAMSSDLREAAFAAPSFIAKSRVAKRNTVDRPLVLASPASDPFTGHDGYLAQFVGDRGATIDTLLITYGRGPDSWADPKRLIGDRTNLDYEVRLIRDWPVAFNLRSEKYGLGFIPHAGIGISNRGNSAEAGATLTFGRKAQPTATVFDYLSVHDGAALDQAGRWYVFAAASGRAMGLNMQRDEAKGWDRSWSMDRASALVGDAQLGLGWRQGVMQTSLGLIHREVKGEHAIWGQEFKTDSMVALSFSIRPKH